MTGVSITIAMKPNLKQLTQLLSSLRVNIQDLRKPFNVIGKGLLLTHDERFRREVSPDGVRWTDNEDSTILNYARKHGGFTKNKKSKGSRINKKGIKRIGIKKILRDTGMLQDTFVYQTTAKSLRFGTSPVTKDYAAVHQFGSIKKNIPARPFLGLSNNDITMVENEIKKHIINQWKLQ